MNATTNIDIERLREAVSEPIFVDAALPIEVRRAQTDLLISLRNAARFLVSLADQDGELWRIDGLCEHGHAQAHDYRQPEPKSRPYHYLPCCTGPDRVRVWPKE